MNSLIKKIEDAAAIVDDAYAQGLSAEITVKYGGLRLDVTRRADGVGYWLSGTFMPEAVEAEGGSEDDIPFT